MQHRKLGSSDLEVSLLGLGCNNFVARLDLEATRKVVDKAIDLGVTMIDTADIYGNYGGSEEYLGQVLGARRNKVVLATKFGMAMNAEGTLKGASPAYIRSSIEGSLKRLKTDWIDLYQLHQDDPKTPLEDTMGALDALVKEGKVRAIGCSNLSAARVRQAQTIATKSGGARFVSAQDEYSLLMRGVERDLLPALKEQGLGLIPFAPLAGGLLSGKYVQGAPMPAGARLSNNKRFADKYITDSNWPRVERLRAFAVERGRTLLDLALGWLAANPLVGSVIAGASTPQQLEQNLKGVEWRLSAEDLAEIDRLLVG